VLLAAFIGVSAWAEAGIEAPASDLKVERFLGQTTVAAQAGRARGTLKLRESLGDWTFMGTVSGAHPYAVFEDFHHQDGHLMFVDGGGVRIDLPKSAESNLPASAKRYLGHSPEEVVASTSDLLGHEILSRAGDPEYATVAEVLPPLQDRLPDDSDGADWLDVYSKAGAMLEGFVGTPDTTDKVYFSSSGTTPTFNPASLQPSIVTVHKEGKTQYGLLGSSLPALRFVYPEANGVWTEMIAFAPFRLVNGNDRFQPVWYRVCRVEGGALKWCHYIDSFHHFPMHAYSDSEIEDGQAFYGDLLDFRAKWTELFSGGMNIHVPDERVENMTRFSMIASLMTRAGDFPKYGILTEPAGPGYGTSADDGFPDAFTVQTNTMIEWGLLDGAARSIDKFLGKFVRDDGSILYRGPETGQYGRMLTVFARYLEVGGDPEVLLRNQEKISGITKLLLAMRSDSLKLPKGDAAYGIIAGWSEADSSMRPDPSRYTQPYFSNNTETARGFQDFGRAWQALGKKTGNAGFVSLGERLTREAKAIKEDVNAAISKSVLKIDGKDILPSIAGAKLPAIAAVERDKHDPQWQYWRVFMEMLESGVLSSAQSDLILDYLASHNGVVLGMPGGALALGAKKHLYTGGMLSADYGYALIETDRIREALLFLYSEMANQYTRGTWFAPEEREPVAVDWTQYSVVAELTVPAMVRWLLVFEDPESDVLWLGRGIPTKWLEDGKTVSVTDAPTKWGRVGFSMTSHINGGHIVAQVTLPGSGLSAETRLRLRSGSAHHIQSVTLNGTSWSNFDPATETIVIPAGTSGDVRIVARYHPELH